jgi:hypothetical protein
VFSDFLELGSEQRRSRQKEKTKRSEATKERSAWREAPL